MNRHSTKAPRVARTAQRIRVAQVVSERKNRDRQRPTPSISVGAAGPKVMSAAVSPGLPIAKYVARHLSAPGVISKEPDGIALFYVERVGGEGGLTLNDADTIEAASAENEIDSWPVSELAAGQKLLIAKRGRWCARGIVLSSIPIGTVVSIYFGRGL
jgi:hypothetical protein